jgi:hypothetical protein
VLSPPAAKLAGYYTHLAELAKGYEKTLKPEESLHVRLADDRTVNQDDLTTITAGNATQENNKCEIEIDGKEEYTAEIF